MIQIQVHSSILTRPGIYSILQFDKLLFFLSPHYIFRLWAVLGEEKEKQEASVVS